MCRTITMLFVLTALLPFNTFNTQASAQVNMPSLRLQSGGAGGDAYVEADSGGFDFQWDDDAFGGINHGETQLLVTAHGQIFSNWYALVTTKCECEADVMTSVNQSSNIPECLVSVGTLNSVVPDDLPDGYSFLEEWTLTQATYEVQAASGETEGTLYATFDVIINPNTSGDVSANASFTSEGGLNSDPSWIRGDFLGIGSGWHITGNLHHHNGGATTVDTYRGDSINEIWTASDDVSAGDITWQQASFSLQSDAVNDGTSASANQWETSITSWYEIEADP